MNKFHRPTTASRCRPALGGLLAALALGVIVAGCGSAKPAAIHPGSASTKTSTSVQTKTSASAQRAKSHAAARRRGQRSRAARQQAQHAAAARASARKRARQAASLKQAAAKVTTKSKSTTTQHAATTPKQTGLVVSVNETKLGGVLIDGKGLTLYLFEKDPPGQSACSGACAGVWPPLITTGKPRAGHGATLSKLGTIARSGGGQQVTYNGHPLYLFAGDSHGGQTTGEGLAQFGGLWWAVSAGGQKVAK